jgi:hypothetical protein
MKIELFFRAVRKPKKIKKGQQCYISCKCGGGTPEDGEFNFSTFVELVDVINYTIFYLLLMNSFRASGSQK